ncbi:hypothetical protein BA177_17050 [Woeseia oceani]|uniref:Uncharacterized protein n=1 Tax=Woeseia oceani TaxID=1548547 RepID=A0A193LJH6_9GAMM|nr:hypothetical protein BA177_17050 [Woeseia oceani]
MSAFSLLLANAGLLLIAISYNLSLYQLVLIYWWEGFWIGLFSALKLIVASLIGEPYQNRWVSVSRGSRILVSIILLVKMGTFYFGLLGAVGLGILLAADRLKVANPVDEPVNQVGLIFVSSLLFLISHGLSFVINFLLRGEFRSARASDLILMPFKRCIALYAVIALAYVVVFAVPPLATTTGFAALVVVAKVSWDYFLHVRERREFTARAAVNTP